MFDSVNSAVAAARSQDVPVAWVRVAFSPLATMVTLFIVLRSLRMTRRDGVVRWRGREYPHESTEF